MRLPDWKERFHAELEASLDVPPAFGTNDCLQFCARCILAMTGEDPAAQFGAYNSELGAAQLMAEYGGVSGILTHAFGEPVCPNWARSGDVITATIEGLETAGMCNGTTCAFVRVPQGLWYASRECIEKTWRID